MSYNDIDDDIEAELRALLEDNPNIEVIELDDASDNEEVTLEEKNEPVCVQSSQEVLNQTGEPIYIDGSDEIVNVLNLNSESLNVLNENGEIMYIQQSDETLNDNKVALCIQVSDETLNASKDDGEPLYIQESDDTLNASVEALYIQDSDENETVEPIYLDDSDVEVIEESKEPLYIQDSDENADAVSEKEESDKEPVENSNENEDELSVEDSKESLNVSDENEESLSHESDGSESLNGSEESENSESDDSSNDSNSSSEESKASEDSDEDPNDLNKSEESVDTEGSDEETNDLDQTGESVEVEKSEEPLIENVGSLDNQKNDEEINVSNENEKPLSDQDVDESQEEKLKDKKDKQDREHHRKEDFNKSKMNKWFLAEFESHMGLKIGESDDTSKPLEESDTEKSSSTSSRRDSDSDSFSEDSLCRWFNKQTNTNRLSVETANQSEMAQKVEQNGSEEPPNNNNVEYSSLPILTGPMPSMPLYDAESNQFKMMETPKPPEPEITEPTKSEEDKPEDKPTKDKTDTKLDPEEEEGEEDLGGSETSSNFSFSSGPSYDLSDLEDISTAKKKLSYWDDMSFRPVDKGEITQEELQAILKEEERLRRIEKGSDSHDNASDESEEEEPIKDPTNLNDGFDFYEDPLTYQQNRENLSFMVIKDEDIFEEYEQAVHRLIRMVPKVPSHHRFEIHLMVYPMMAITYMQMVAGDNMQRAIDFLEKESCQLNESYTSRLTKLADICRLEDIPNKARKQLAGYEKLELHMSKGAFRQLLFQLEEWPRSHQEKVLTHFRILSYSEDEKPQQRPILGKPVLEVLFWAAPEPLHKKEFTVRPFLRGRRKKRNESPPHRNVHFPPGERIFTPTPKRMDLLHRKNDEKHRVKLDRDNLPSTYLYTAPASDDVVLCATFSEANTMIALGTLASSIHVFSLKPTKLVQLKSASWLKILDTGMAGIDKGMIDPLKKYTRRTLLGHQGPVYSCCFNPEDRYLLSCSEDFSVRLWCLLSWCCIVIYPGHLSPVCHVIFAPLGYYFATASDDGMARIWTQDCKKPTRILEGHLAELTMCLFHPNRHYLATASADCTVRMWDVINGTEIRLFRGHRRRISIMTFSLCGRYLVSGGDDNLIMIWDTALERLIRYLDYHNAHINTMEFCLDNNLLVVGGQDCQLSIWDFQRLLQDYGPAKSSKKRKECAAKDPLAVATQEELLISAYSTKNAPFYLIRFTRRNLLLAFCVSPDDPKGHRSKTKQSLDQMKTEACEWLQFLDMAKFRGACESDFDLHIPEADDEEVTEKEESKDDGLASEPQSATSSNESGTLKETQKCL
ncbi:uncharacterized protein Dana_GF23833, isoform C [Drosophila ananassae]|uniref:Uncharacterized protein, isoform C n=1 Tax=Drosophila ananassae TaxID=7217 RepID=A0A0P8ZVP8_DROAN|nr:uncharacterized protein LOC6506471 isoform X2 [Drosophila ananassae]KPU78646.1 uncharacterized protein Dana_GF23833, isoform C [Drosophila ananassae]